MLDPERLLAGMFRQGLKKSRRGKKSGIGLDSLFGSKWKTAAGIGAIGVAIAAFEHFASNRGASAGSSPPPAPYPSGSGVTPSAAPPPPPPMQTGATGSVPRPPVQEGEVTVSKDDAMLLIQAMAAAANADGRIDPSEKGAILSQLEKMGVTDEERAFVNGLLDSPVSIDSILPKVNRRELANQVYLVSLAAITVDTKAEKDYLAYLRMRLDLDSETVRELHQRFGVES